MIWKFQGIVAGIGGTVFALALATNAGAQTYPSRPITFVVGFAAGGFADSVARIIGDHVSKQLGQSIVVENRDGAGSNIAAHLVADAKPDGYTVLVSTTGVAINASLYKNLGYSLVDDLVPVAISVRAPETISAKPGGAKTFKEFIDSAKTKQLTFSTAGIGTGSHLTWFYFFHNIAKVDALHVPYDGGSPAMQATIGGEVDAFAGTASGGLVAQLAGGGKLTCLAVAAAKRYDLLPNCPSLAELGYPGYDGSSWVGFWVPKGTPENAITALNGAINSVSQDKPAAGKLIQNGDLLDFSPTEADKFVRDEVASWRERVVASGATVE